MSKSGKFGGRPKREAELGERVHVGFRVTPEMKLRLQHAADARGRSVSQEAEMRLDRSFDREDLLPQALSLVYGPRAAGLVLAIAAAMDKAGFSEVVSSQYETYHWVDSPPLYKEAEQAANVILRAFRPHDHHPEFSPLPPPNHRRTGQECAKQLLEELASDAHSDQDWSGAPLEAALTSYLFRNQMKPMRELLGRLTDRIKGAGHEGKHHSSR